jgi:hypothetical protein
MNMNKTRTRIESTRRRARGTLRNVSSRASRLPVTYAKAWAREMGAWTELATDVFDGSVSLRDAFSGMMALSFSGLQASVDLGREVCELIIHPISPSGALEFHLDGKSESADPIELDVTPPVTLGELKATDLKNVDNPGGPSIPASHVRFTTPQAPSQPVLVSLTELRDLVATLPDGTYEGKIRKGGVEIATIRALVDN